MCKPFLPFTHWCSVFACFPPTNLQNFQIFRSKIGSTRKGLKSKCDFFFVDAPFPAVSAPIEEDEAAENDTNVGQQDPGNSWWQWTDIEPGTRPSKAAQYTGLDISLDTINKAIEQHKPIHGLLGFSQGATMAALYLSMSTDQNAVAAATLQDIRIALIISGFLPRDKSYAEIITTAKPNIPTMFVAGEQDVLVPVEKSAALWEHFSIKEVYKHKGSHFVPTCSGEYKAAVIKFLDEHGKKKRE